YQLIDFLRRHLVDVLAQLVHAVNFTQKAISHRRRPFSRLRLRCRDLSCLLYYRRARGFSRSAWPEDSGLISGDLSSAAPLHFVADLRDRWPNSAQAPTKSRPKCRVAANGGDMRNGRHATRALRLPGRPDLRRTHRLCHAEEDDDALAAAARRQCLPWRWRSSCRCPASCSSPTRRPRMSWRGRSASV